MREWCRQRGSRRSGLWVLLSTARLTSRVPEATLELIRYRARRGLWNSWTHPSKPDLLEFFEITLLTKGIDGAMIK
jgi:hypothetical protein